MHIVHIASEFAPIAKAGGLGEVVVGLVRELNLYGHPAEVLLPKYPWITPSKEKIDFLSIPSIEPSKARSSRVYSREIERCPLHLIDLEKPSEFFTRKEIYGYPDDAVRFLNFCLACIDYLATRKQPIDILHLHDWHTAAVAALVRGPLASRLPPIHKIVLTIHNLEYQGQCSPSELEEIGIPFSKTWQDNRYPEAANLLKGGIAHADQVTTVSPSYAREIQNKANSFGLHEELKRARVKGILNGIDTHRWDPNADAAIPLPYEHRSSTETILNAKQAVKKSLQKRFNIRVDTGPWIGSITRLVPQKGPELIQEALKETLRQGGNFLLLGTSPIPAMQETFTQIKNELLPSKQLLLEYAYNESLAHEIYAACDFLIVPSDFEPCGLSQMIALRYGTIPIVRATGGLKDTVFDYENSQVAASRRNGIVFEPFTTTSARETIDRAFTLWKDQTTFQWLVRHGMQQEFGWRIPCSHYLRLYEKLLNNPIQQLKQSSETDVDLPKHSPTQNQPHKAPRRM